MVEWDTNLGRFIPKPVLWTVTCPAISQGQFCRCVTKCSHTTHSPTGEDPRYVLEALLLPWNARILCLSLFCEISQMGWWSMHWGHRDAAHMGFHLLEMCPQTPRSKPGALSPAQILPLNPHVMDTATLCQGEWADLSDRAKAELHHHPLSTAGASLWSPGRVGCGSNSGGLLGWGKALGILPWLAITVMHSVGNLAAASCPPLIQALNMFLLLLEVAISWGAAHGLG